MRSPITVFVGPLSGFIKSLKFFPSPTAYILHPPHLLLHFPIPHPCPPTTALMHAKPANFKAILDDIEQHFDLDQHALDVITNKFLEDFNTGLGKYGEPMAMMYVG